MTLTINDLESNPQRDHIKYCCLVVPVRYILLTLSTITLLLSAIYGTVGVLVLQRLNTYLEDVHRVAVYFHIFIHFSFGLICIFGFYAVLSRRYRATSFYVAMTIGQLLFSLGSGATCLYFLFKAQDSRDLSLNQCMSHSSDVFTRNLCQRSPVMKGLAVTSLIIIWLVEITIFVVGNRFLSQLREEAIQLEMIDPKYERDGFDC